MALAICAARDDARSLESRNSLFRATRDLTNLETRFSPLTELTMLSLIKFNKNEKPLHNRGKMVSDKIQGFKSSIKMEAGCRTF